MGGRGSYIVRCLYESLNTGEEFAFPIQLAYVEIVGDYEMSRARPSKFRAPKEYPIAQSQRWTDQKDNEP